MFSGGVDEQRALRRNAVVEELVRNEPLLDRWLAHSPSSIVHHDAHCCEDARLWLLAYSRSMELRTLPQFDIKAPAWLSQLYTWGPSEWPISWCRLVTEKVLDCGVFAALAREVFTAQGHEAHPAQALLSYNEACTRHWQRYWQKGSRKHKEKTYPWIGDHVVYHEICALELADGTARLYDSTWGTWYTPHRRVGFGALLAVRTDCPRLLRWGDKTLSCGEWVSL